MKTISTLTTVNLEFFARILFSRIALKDIFVKLNIRDLGHDIHISVNDRANSAFHEDFVLKLCIRGVFTKKKNSQKFPNLQ